MPTSVCCRTPVGHDDPGVPRRSCPERGMVAGGDPQHSTPIFFLAPQKENGGGAVKRKNAFRYAVTGAERPPAQRDAAISAASEPMPPADGRELEQWFGGQDGVASILNSLKMFEQD